MTVIVLDRNRQSSRGDQKTALSDASMTQPRSFHSLRQWLWNGFSYAREHKLRILRRSFVTSFKILNLACAVHVFGMYVGKISVMLGPSMLPTFRDYDVVLEDRLSLRLNPYNLVRGDLITLKSPLDPARIVCKRILGLPGDVVCVDPTGQTAPSTEHVKIPKGHVWIVGDNADASRDSRVYGPVSMALIQSKLVAQVWPPGRWKILRNPTTILEQRNAK